jgi:hypothetical protein
MQCNFDHKKVEKTCLCLWPWRVFRRSSSSQCFKSVTFFSRRGPHFFRLGAYLNPLKPSYFGGIFLKSLIVRRGCFSFLTLTSVTASELARRHARGTPMLPPIPCPVDAVAQWPASELACSVRWKSEASLSSKLLCLLARQSFATLNKRNYSAHVRVFYHGRCQAPVDEAAPH